MTRTLIIPRWIALVAVALAALLTGIFASPYNAENRPVLLLPSVRDVLIYQDAIGQWVGEAHDIDAQIDAVLGDQFGNDLYAKSEASAHALDSANRLAKEIDRQKTPQAALPARALTVQLAADYQSAARTLLLWVTASNDENRAAARQALTTARASLAALEESEWHIKNQKP